MKNLLLKVNCPHCNFINSINLDDGYFQLTVCDSETGGCDTRFIAEVFQTTENEAGKYCCEMKIVARKIEGVEPSNNNFYGTGNWKDYVAVQLAIGDKTAAAIEVIEKSRLTDERARAKRETEGKGGLRILAQFQAFENETEAGGTGEN